MKMHIGCGWAQKGQRAKSRFLLASRLPLFRIGRKLGAQSQAGDGCSANNTPLVVAGNARGGAAWKTSYIIITLLLKCWESLEACFPTFVKNGIIV